MIPIKGYATFDPLKSCLIGKNFSGDFFKRNISDSKVADPLRRIADETEEDYQNLEKILKDANIKTYRIEFDEDKFDKDWHVRPPVCPRDHFAVIGETFYAYQLTDFYGGFLKNISKENLAFGNKPVPVSTAVIARVGKDLFWDVEENSTQDDIDFFKTKWTAEGFRVHVSKRGYHSDGSFCVVKPGCIVTLKDVQDYAKEFPGWDVLYLPDQSWKKVHPFTKIKKKVNGRWWIPGEEDNDKLIHFVNTWLKDWVGYVEETVFDVNMLSIDQNTIICNNYNKEVFEHFKKHKVEPILFNFRHRYFWDGGIHCVTQDLYREGTQEDYFA
jgi:hypothetical protein|tara:strand:- start:2380 stop:3363 length:984 start_codon:yes stop_codon:yes gene_type:complete